jgi:hypothetical protein
METLAKEGGEDALGHVRCVLQHWVLRLKTVLMAVTTIMMTLRTDINYF